MSSENPAANLEGVALTEYLNQLNSRVRAGEEVSDDELRSAILALRSRRKFAADKSPTTKKAAVEPLTDLQSLFGKKETEQPEPKAKVPFDFDALFKKGV